MSDLVDRLRESARQGWDMHERLFGEAADEIERLRAAGNAVVFAAWDDEGVDLDGALYRLNEALKGADE